MGNCWIAAPAVKLPCCEQLFPSPAGCTKRGLGIAWGRLLKTELGLAPCGQVGGEISLLFQGAHRVEEGALQHWAVSIRVASESYL